MSRPEPRTEFAADTFVAAAGRGIHLLRQRVLGADDGGGDEPFSHVVVQHAAGVGAACWNRNNKVVATGGGDGAIQLSYHNGQVMAVLPRDEVTRAADLGAITGLSWSCGSKRLAAGSDRGSVFVFDMAAQGGKLPPTELPGHLGGVTAVEFQHEDKFLAVASGGGSVTLYSEPHRTGAAGAVPLRPAVDTSGRLSLSVASVGEPSVAAGSAAGSVTVWDVTTQKVREHYANQHSGGVAALGFLPLRPGMLYSAGADSRVCLQDRQAGPGHVSTFTLGAPATALMVKEDHSVLGVGTADGVVLLYDPRHVRQPLHTLPLETRAPVTSLHWQHRYVALPGSRRSAAAAAPAAAAGAQAASKGPGPSRLGMPPSGSMAPAAPATTPAASVAASIGAAAASIGSCIPAAPAAAPTPAGGGPTPAAAATAEPAGDAAASYASRPAGAASQPGSSAAAVRAKLAADSLQLHPLSAARHRPPGDAADGRRTSMSAPDSRAVSPAPSAAAPAAALQRSASSHAAAPQAHAAAATPAASMAAGSAAGGLQVTPLHRPAATAAASGLAVTPLPGMDPHRSAAAAAEVTPMQQQPRRGAEAAADVAQRLQRLGVTPLGGGTPVAATGQQRQQLEQQQQAAPLTPLERLAAAPVDLNITPLVAPPAGRQTGAAVPPASGRRPAAAAPLPLDVTPLAGGAAGADRRSLLCISPLPGMAAEPQPAGSASPQRRSVLAERTNSGHASPGAVPLTSGRRGLLPRLALPLPVDPGAEQPPLQGSTSFAENQPLPSPAAGGQQYSGGVAAEEKLKAASAAGVQAHVALTPAGSGAQWTIPTVPADAEMAEAAPSSTRPAAELVSHPLEFSFAAAQRSLEQLSSGAAWGSGGGGSAAPVAGVAEAAAGLPPGLRDDILALHWDMLQQFQAQQACMGQLVSQVLERNEALSAEVAALRKQLSQLTGRRDQFLWL